MFSLINGLWSDNKIESGIKSETAKQMLKEKVNLNLQSFIN